MGFEPMDIREESENTELSGNWTELENIEKWLFERQEDFGPWTDIRPPNDKARGAFSFTVNSTNQRNETERLNGTIPLMFDHRLTVGGVFDYILFSGL